MYSTSEYKIGYHQATENGCWFCSVRAGSTDFLRGQQAKRVSSKLCLTQNIERPHGIKASILATTNHIDPTLMNPEYF